MRLIGVMIVQSQTLVRELLIHQLTKQPDFRVLPSAVTTRESIPAAFERKPDVVLMDTDMPGMICFQAAKQILMLCRQTRILFWAAEARAVDVRRLLEIKGHGMVLKREPSSQLFEAIRRLAAGGTYHSQEVAACIEVMGRSKASDGAGLPKRWHDLTPCERDVLQYLASGLSKKQIATLLQVSIKTIEGHTQKVMYKLNIHNRVCLTRYAIREGVVHA